MDEPERQARKTISLRRILELKNMNDIVTHETLHRTAKYFMDSGRAASHEDAMDLLRDFGLYIEVGPEVATSRDHQIALLTLVGYAMRARCSARTRPMLHQR